MQWSDAIQEQIETIKPVKQSPEIIQRIMGLIDLTSLNDSDTEASVSAFMQKAQTQYGHVAGVCVYPQFMRLVADALAGTPIKAATVANFPEGATPLDSVLLEIGRALEDGAQEIDVVFPYQRYLAGERKYAHTFVETCKAACGSATLKVILETGALNDPAIIADASFDVIAAGADFIKTSTGKINPGATLEAAATMLLVIKHMSAQLNRPVGFKASGGIKDIQQATQYIQLADQIMGVKWVNPGTFRIGASRLMDELIAAMPG